MGALVNRLCGWLVAVVAVCLSLDAHAATCGSGTADADAVVMAQHSLTRKRPRIEVLLFRLGPRDGTKGRRELIPDSRVCRGTRTGHFATRSRRYGA